MKTRIKIALPVLLVVVFAVTGAGYAQPYPLRWLRQPYPCQARYISGSSEAGLHRRT